MYVHLKIEIGNKWVDGQWLNNKEQPFFKRVVIESPYAGDTERNLRYARACVVNSIRIGEAPILLHLLYAQHGILNDNDPEERMLGMMIGFHWGSFGDIVAVYMDLGITKEMELGIKRAEMLNQDIEYRLIPDWEDDI